MPKYERVAARFCEQIRALASNEDNLNNLESYLSYHFPAWMKEYANTPTGLVYELEVFANMT